MAYQRTQRGMLVCVFIALLCYIAGNIQVNPALQIATILLCGMAILCFVILCHKNISFMVIKRLLKEPSVLSIVALTSFNLCMEIFAPYPFSVTYGLAYMLLQICYCFSDAVVYKSWKLVLCLGVLSVALNIFNIYGNTFGDWNADIVLLEYDIQGYKYRIMKRGAKVSTYFQILLFSVNGVYTMFVDRSMEIFMFASGNVYKKEILAPVHYPASIKRRIKWAQRGVGTFALSSIACFILGSNMGNNAIVITALSLGCAAFACFACLFFKNISFAMVRRLLKESNAIIIIGLTLVHFIIEIVWPRNSRSPYNGLAYSLLNITYVFLDALILKSRYFVLAIGMLFIALNLYLVYANTFGSWDMGYVLLEHNIHGKEYLIMKRQTKCSIYLQILLFSINSVYIMFEDKEMQFMIFATDNIYKSTGTSSKDVEDQNFSDTLQRELAQINARHTTMQKNAQV